MSMYCGFNVSSVAETIGFNCGTYTIEPSKGVVIQGYSIAVNASWLTQLHPGIGSPRRCNIIQGSDNDGERGLSHWTAGNWMQTKRNVIRVSCPLIHVHRTARISTCAQSHKFSSKKAPNTSEGTAHLYSDRIKSIRHAVQNHSSSAQPETSKRRLQRWRYNDKTLLYVMCALAAASIGSIVLPDVAESGNISSIITVVLWMFDHWNHRVTNWSWDCNVNFNLSSAVFKVILDRIQNKRGSTGTHARRKKFWQHRNKDRRNGWKTSLTTRYSRSSKIKWKGRKLLV